MKKQVLHLIGSFHQGGSERQALALARMLKNEGSFDVSLATMNGDGVLRDEAKTMFGKIAEFSIPSFYSASFIGQVRRFARYLREQKIDIIHTHDFYTNVFGMSAAMLARVPVRVASKRETGSMRTQGQEAVEKIAFRVANVITANSAAVRNYLTSRGIDVAKIKVIYNGVDLDRFTVVTDARATVAKKYGLPPRKSDQLVTMVANLRHDVKNVPMLLRAMTSVITQSPRTHFVIAGEGELETSLKQLAAQLGVDKNVHFIGRCDEVPSLLAASSVCVLTSSDEGFSNSILEYMAAAKPVIATNVGGAREVISNGKTGHLVRPDDDAALATHLSELLDNRKKAQAMGEAGREVIAARFTAERQLSAVLSLYEKEMSLAARRNKVKYEPDTHSSSSVLNSRPASNEK